MVEVRLKNVTKQFGEVKALDNIDLTIESGEFRAIIGPTGCGKTTLLRIIAGLETPTKGRVYFDTQDVTDYSPRERNIALVFQNYALYPHLNVFDNMAQPLISAKWDKGKIQSRVREVAEFLRITDLLQRKPAQLSGGQQQRVAIGRALVRNPVVLLLDEPLSNLDAQLRFELRGEMKKLIKRTGITSIYVTHDQVEAMSMADKITVMKDGLILQSDEPISLYERPVNTFVGRFVGSPEMNVLPVEITGDGTGSMVSIGDYGIRFDSGINYRGKGFIGFRPHKIHFSSTGIKGRITNVEPLGNMYIYHVDVGLAREIILTSEEAKKSDAEVYCSIDTSYAILFDSTGKRIS